MIVYEFKAKGQTKQFKQIDDAIRITQFVRNKALRYWIDNQGVKAYDLNKYTAVLAKEFDFCNKLNSMARQSAAERTAFAINRFYSHCKSKKTGKKAENVVLRKVWSCWFPAENNFPRRGSAQEKRFSKTGYPKFQKNCRSVEYKNCGWKLTPNRKYITFTDKCGIGQLKLIGTYDLHYYQIEQIKRVRIVKRSDGYYIQFCMEAERNIDITPTGKTIGLDVGLNHFYTDSNGNTVDNPRFLRKAEKALKRLQKNVSRKKKGSNNRKKAINKLGRKHLKVSRQRKDFAVKQALCVIKSNDFVAREDLSVKNMVKNHKLAKSISDVSWSLFAQWLEYFARCYGKVVVAVPPQYTSQNCSNCGEIVKKTLSVRTHICNCGCVLDRDLNASLNILAKGLKQVGYIVTNTVGHTGINASGQNDLCLTSVNLLDKLIG